MADLTYLLPTLHILTRIIIKYTKFLRSAELKLTKLFNVQHDQSKDYRTGYEVKDEYAALEQEQHQPAPDAPLLEIRISMFLRLQDPDPLVRGTDPDPSLFWKNSCKTRF